MDYGYLLNYNPTTQEISNFTKFQFNNEPIESLISHFDGITRTETGFNLTGDFVSIEDGAGAFFASVSFNPDTGHFGPAVWTEIAFPGADVTSGNTVVEDSVLGVYVVDGSVTSYLAAVPEPHAAALFALAIGIACLRLRRRLRA